MGLLSDQQTDPPLTFWFPKHTSFPHFPPLFLQSLLCGLSKVGLQRKIFFMPRLLHTYFCFPFFEIFLAPFYFASRKTSAQLFQRFSEQKQKARGWVYEKVRDWMRNHKKLRNKGKRRALCGILISCCFPRLGSKIFTIPKSRASHLLNGFSQYSNQVFFPCIRKLKYGKSRFFSQLGTYVRIVRTFIHIHVLFACTVYLAFFCGMYIHLVYANPGISQFPGFRKEKEILTAAASSDFGRRNKYDILLFFKEKLPNSHKHADARG